MCLIFYGDVRLCCILEYDILLFMCITESLFCCRCCALSTRGSNGELVWLVQAVLRVVIKMSMCLPLCIQLWKNNDQPFY